MEALPIELLTQTAEFAVLTDQQKLFVATYVSSNYDRLLATRTAYKCKNDHTAGIMSYAVLKNPRIVSCLARHSGKDDKEVFLDSLRNSIALGRIDPVKLRAWELYAKVKGWAVEDIIRLKRNSDRKVRRMKAKTKAEKVEPKPSIDYGLVSLEKPNDAQNKVKSGDWPSTTTG